MKRLLPCLLCLTLLLAGCADAARERMESFAGDLAARQELDLTAELRAEYEDRSLAFTLCCREADGCCTVMVLAPDMLKGVRARMNAGDDQLIYGDVTLDTGPLDRSGLSPLSALPTLLRAVREGHLDSTWTEGDRSVGEWILDDGLSVRVWVESTSLTPTHAELISDGRVTVFLDITDWR